MAAHLRLVVENGVVVAEPPPVLELPARPAVTAPPRREQEDRSEEIVVAACVLGLSISALIAAVARFLR
jgi:hypothetical protein